MRLFKRMRTDFAIYWQRTGVADDGTPQLLSPVVIKCRWDFQQRDREIAEATENISSSGTVFPDRVLVVGSFLLHGGKEVLNALSEKEKANPALIQGAVAIKTQKITPEWRVRNVQWKPNDQPNNALIEVTI
jgi:hypothetical protein